MSKAVRDMASLRSEVRELGAALGRVITRIEGSETFDTVEALRKLAKARRANDTGAERLLAKAVANLEPQAAFNQAMAFTLYFELVNLAEENFRIILLRRRRVARALGQDDGRPIRESIEAAVFELKAAGVGADQMQQLVDRLGIELVFHGAPDRDQGGARLLGQAGTPCGGILRTRAQPESTPDSARSSARTRSSARIRLAHWLTDRSRTVRPGVTGLRPAPASGILTTRSSTRCRGSRRTWEESSLTPFSGRSAPAAVADLRVMDQERRPRRQPRGDGGDDDGRRASLLHRRLAIDKLRTASSGLTDHTLTVSDRRDSR